MRTYDPADRICYVHLAQVPAAPPAPPPADDECRRLAAGYANESLRVRLGDAAAGGGRRPALVVLPGGSAAGTSPDRTAPALRLAR
ncbi:hypothetical protein [Geodermatophilus sp. CPCC 206100]|uniref:hypothetical protein n=1 Tax=Geodermatophilus sp. CPCC 206100 TaxID=3020054 RepID=UPI003AFF6FFD